MATATRRRRTPKPGADVSLTSRNQHPRGDRQFVTALARGLEILNCFRSATKPISGTELATMTGLPQPTVWRLCHTMMQLGYLIPSNDERMRPGIPLLRLGHVALASVPIAESAHGRMAELAKKFDAAVSLAAQDGPRMIYVQRCLREARVVANFKVGSRIRLGTSAIGWGFLAGFKQDEREKLITEFAASDPLWRKTEPIFRREVAAYDERGYIFELGVFHPAYNTIAFPIMGIDGRPAFALTLSGSALTHTVAFLRRNVAPELRSLVSSLEQELQQPR